MSIIYSNFVMAALAVVVMGSRDGRLQTSDASRPDVLGHEEEDPDAGDRPLGVDHSNHRARHAQDVAVEPEPLPSWTSPRALLSEGPALLQPVHALESASALIEAATGRTSVQVIGIEDLPSTTCAANGFFMDWGSSGMKVFPVNNVDSSARLRNNVVKFSQLVPDSNFTILFRQNLDTTLTSLREKLSDAGQHHVTVSQAALRLLREDRDWKVVKNDEYYYVELVSVPKELRSVLQEGDVILEGPVPEGRPVMLHDPLTASAAAKKFKLMQEMEIGTMTDSDNIKLTVQSRGRSAIMATAGFRHLDAYASKQIWRMVRNFSTPTSQYPVFNKGFLNRCTNWHLHDHDCHTMSGSLEALYEYSAVLSAANLSLEPDGDKPGAPASRMEIKQVGDLPAYLNGTTPNAMVSMGGASMQFAIQGKPAMVKSCERSLAPVIQLAAKQGNPGIQPVRSFDATSKTGSAGDDSLLLVSWLASDGAAENIERREETISHLAGGLNDMRRNFDDWLENLYCLNKTTAPNQPEQPDEVAEGVCSTDGVKNPCMWDWRSGGQNKHNAHGAAHVGGGSVLTDSSGGTHTRLNGAMPRTSPDTCMRIVRKFLQQDKLLDLWKRSKDCRGLVQERRVVLLTSFSRETQLGVKVDGWQAASDVAQGVIAKMAYENNGHAAAHHEWGGQNVITSGFDPNAVWKANAVHTPITHALLLGFLTELGIVEDGPSLGGDGEASPSPSATSNELIQPTAQWIDGARDVDEASSFRVEGWEKTAMDHRRLHKGWLADDDPRCDDTPAEPIPVRLQSLPPQEGGAVRNSRSSLLSSCTALALVLLASATALPF